MVRVDWGGGLKLSVKIHSHFRTDWLSITALGLLAHLVHLQGLSISLPYSCHSYSMKITSSWSYRIIAEFGLTQSENAIILIGNFRKSGLITSYCTEITV